MMLGGRLIGLVREVPLYAALTILLALGAIACAVGQGFTVAHIVARVIRGDALSSLSWLLVLAAVFILGRAALIWAKEMAGLWTAAVIKRRVRRRLYSKLQALGPGYLTGNKSGDVQATVVDGVEALQAYVGFYLPQAVVAIVAPAAIIVCLMTIDVVVGLVVLLGAAVVPTARPFLQRTLSLKGQSLWDAYSLLSSRFLDSFQGMTTLKAFNAVDSHREGVRREAIGLYNATMQNLLVSSIVYILVTVAFGVGTALAVAVGALRLTDGALTTTELLVVLFLAAECFRPLLELQNYWHEGFYGLAASSGIFGMLDAEPVVKDAGPSGRRIETRRAPRIAFEGVGFAYPGAEGQALSDVSFSIEAGETVAVVGRSGAGKTTLVSLLLRFFDPQAGRITVDGVDLRNVSLESCRELSALVSQDIYLFHNTVAANLRIAKPDATDEELIAVARAANAHDFVMALDYGYDTIVGERGVLLSGGQRQRLAIARAILKGAPFLILDEATSSVDGENEAAIQEAMERVSIGRTTLVIAHRLSTVSHARRVFVLEEGRLAEAGTPQELLARPGLFTRLTEAARGAV